MILLFRRQLAAENGFYFSLPVFFSYCDKGHKLEPQKSLDIIIWNFYGLNDEYLVVPKRHRPFYLLSTLLFRAIFS